VLNLDMLDCVDVRRGGGGRGWLFWKRFQGLKGPSEGRWMMRPSLL